MRAARIRKSPKTIAKAATPPPRKRVLLASAARISEAAPPNLDPDDTTLLKIAEVAAILRVTERTVRTYMRNGLLRKAKFGFQTTRIYRDSVLKLMGALEAAE